MGIRINAVGIREISLIFIMGNDFGDRRKVVTYLSYPPYRKREFTHCDSRLIRLHLMLTW